MDIKVEKKGKKLDKILKNIQKLNKQVLEVGHFSDQGLHYSGMTYPELLAYWARGITVSGVGGRVIQDPKSQFIFQYLSTHDFSKNVRIKAALDKWYRNLTNNPNPSLLDNVGLVLQEEYKDVFGIFKGPYMAGTDTPMLETGDLQDNVTYRKSRGG